MVEQRSRVVRLLMWEVGKSLADSEKEFDRTVQYIRDTVDALKDLDRVSSRFTISEGVLGQIRRAPLGVALCMGPFNYPLNETFTTLIPALIMGNTVVFKPPRFGVLLWAPLLEAFRDSFPPGVVNTVYGKGRPSSGRSCGRGNRRPGVHRDQPRRGCPEEAAPAPAQAALSAGPRRQEPGDHSGRRRPRTRGQGVRPRDAELQRPALHGAEILFVHRAIADEFLKRFGDAVNELKCGPPWVDGVSITPLPEPGKAVHLGELIADAAKQGARVVNPGGGESLESFFRPAVVAPVTAGMRLWSEEQFGPVVPVAVFDDIETPCATSLSPTTASR